MTLIDSSYFTGEILLTNKTALASDLTQAITKYEKEILISLLGYELYDLMNNNQTIEPYKSLIEGAEFSIEFDGITQTIKWEGLKNSAKESLIAYYVYYQYQKRNFIKPSAISSVKPLAENADISSPYPAMVEAWNRMIDLYGYFPNSWFMRSNASIMQPDGGLIYNNAPSAFNYMSANIDSFPKWIFTPLKTINSFGI